MHCDDGRGVFSVVFRPLHQRRGADPAADDNGPAVFGKRGKAFSKRPHDVNQISFMELGEFFGALPTHFVDQTDSTFVRIGLADGNRAAQEKTLRLNMDKLSPLRLTRNFRAEHGDVIDFLRACRFAHDWVKALCVSHSDPPFYSSMENKRPSSIRRRCFVFLPS